MTSKSILNKPTGNITITSFSAGEVLDSHISSFDTYIQIVEGVAELMINKVKHEIKIGEAIIIPAHSEHQFKANEQFKMISTVFKSGYEY